MRYEWDPVKDEQNQRKHDLDLAEGIPALNDSNLQSWVDDANDYGEVRDITLGFGRREILYVVSTLKLTDLTRIISVRKANKYERYCYHHGRS